MVRRLLRGRGDALGVGRGDALSGERARGLRGVGVIPGMYVFADSSGAVVIPPGDFEEVLVEARSIETEDAVTARRSRGR